MVKITYEKTGAREETLRPDTMSYHWKITAAVLTIALTGAGLLTLVLFAGRADPGSGPPIELHSPYGLYSPGTLDEVPTSAGREMIEALGMDSLGAYQNFSLGLVKEVGVSWVRMDFIFDGWNYLEPADYLNKLHTSGLEVVGCVRPINKFSPANLAVFKEETRRLVRRYPWITVWQIGNEPNLSWDDPGDYPRFFLAGREAVQYVCPSCKVALAGAAAIYPSQLSDSDVISVYHRIIEEIVRQTSEGSQPFDIFDLHYYGNYGSDSDVLDSIGTFRDLLASHGLDRGIDLWVTETATTSGQPSWPSDSPPQSEDQQAAELVKRFATMLSTGASRVSWARPYENYRYADDEGNFYNNTGLVYNGLGQEEAADIKAGTRKMAFFAYKTMVAETGNAAEVQRLAPGQYRFSFDNGRPPVYILWSDTNSSIPSELTGLVNITDMNGIRTATEAEDVVLSPMPVFVENR